jgi:cytochrome c556
MFHRSIKLIAGLIGLATAGLSQQAAGVAGAAVIAARQASLDMSSITLRSMSDAIKAGREPSSQGYAAAVLAKWAKALPEMFPQGTGKGDTSASTQALATIWLDQAGFRRAAANYADATARLAALAASNDTAGFTRQLEEVNQACGSCHGSYKEGAQGPPKK